MDRPNPGGDADDGKPVDPSQTPATAAARAKALELLRKHRGRRLIARLGWMAALAYMAFIFVLSSMPGEELPLPQFFLADKLAHFVTYFGLGVLIAFRSGLTDIAKGRPVTAWTKGGWIAPAIGMLYGVFDEIHQLYTPNRTFEIADLLVDFVGVALGFWLARRWDKRRLAAKIAGIA